MQKKYTATFFLTLASIILLAFAVVPHHHHEQYICFNTFHCPSEAPSASHSHDKNPFSNQEGCVKNLFQTQVSRNQSLQHSCTSGHCHHYILTFFLLPAISDFLSFEAELQVGSVFFYRERLHALGYTSHFSGRAPPYQA